MPHTAVTTAVTAATTTAAGGCLTTLAQAPRWMAGCVMAVSLVAVLAMLVFRHLFPAAAGGLAALVSSLSRAQTESMYRQQEQRLLDAADPRTGLDYLREVRRSSVAVPEPQTDPATHIQPPDTRADTPP
ncbi:hypothetical protein AB0E04_43995 [Streptomyces sp. NPDC048251]|uniref:hypothetical protein n=1 Tax=Streptomyces sp. NPDC048251 TaxID=3154501 RepID=UPI003417DB0C